MKGLAANKKDLADGQAKAALHSEVAHEDRARAVLELEAAALAELAAAVPADFAAAVDLILSGSGRVIVAGVGKSGHVGRKIAATLASTGTPAYFVHASEASHGDLGMITSSDICLLISSSGETTELSDLIAFCRRYSVPLIGISRRPESTLMRAVDLKLTLPDFPEACAIGMAPTTSTTLTMALGDALAVALMEARGFRADNFRIFHPGGKLGAQLAQVEKIMHPDTAIPVVAETAAMPEVLLAMTSGGFGVAAVLSRDRILAGVVTDGDLRRNMGSLMQLTAGAVATRSPITVRPDTLAADALALMNKHKITVLIVTDLGDRPVGILHIHDLLRFGVA